MRPLRVCVRHAPPNGPAVVCSSQRCLVTVTSPAAVARATQRDTMNSFMSHALREDMSIVSFDAAVSKKALARAERVVTEAEEARASMLNFYNKDTGYCRLCNMRLEGSYVQHTHTVNHKPRIGVVKRAIGLILTFLEQTSASPVSATSPPSVPGEPTLTSTTASTHAAVNAAPGTSPRFSPPLGESPLFGGAGLPSRDIFHHRTQTLREVDLVEALLRHWWSNLQGHKCGGYALSFDRIGSLSAEQLEPRRWRVRYLLHFLKSRGLLRSSLFSMLDANTTATSDGIKRDAVFERLETVGDCVFKGVTMDRLAAAFPSEEAGVTAGLRGFERALDSNRGLLTIYDYLNLDDITGSFLANNKTKADVVEAFIGELSMLLSSTEVACGTESYVLPGERANVVYLRAVVAHLISEVAHVVIMWHIETSLRQARAFILKHTVEDHISMKEEKRKKDASAGGTAMLSPVLHRYALLPPLLSWETCPASSAERLSPSPTAPAAESPQALLRCLAATPSRVPDIMRERYAVGTRRWSSDACDGAMAALRAVLGHTGVHAESADDVAVSFPDDLQPFPKAASRERGAALSVPPSLLADNCVVIS
ncbi:RNA editing complex protein MP67 [Novymonas esmeraldas]|uniref:RNA editing complex protein MP67 n=1 Tax=Novymonas esmeraldas TaxID=1808958 RepID=A0AAW0F7P1_9TRYP